MVRKYAWTATITKEDKKALDSLSSALGFINKHKSMYYGKPNPVALIAAIRAAYESDPTAVTAAFEELGIKGDTKPLDLTQKSLAETQKQLQTALAAHERAQKLHQQAIERLQKGTQANEE